MAYLIFSIVNYRYLFVTIKFTHIRAFIESKLSKIDEYIYSLALVWPFNLFPDALCKIEVFLFQEFRPKFSKQIACVCWKQEIGTKQIFDCASKNIVLLQPMQYVKNRIGNWWNLLFQNILLRTPFYELFAHKSQDPSTADGFCSEWENVTHTHTHTNQI